MFFHYLTFSFTIYIFTSFIILIWYTVQGKHRLWIHMHRKWILQTSMLFYYEFYISWWHNVTLLFCKMILLDGFIICYSLSKFVNTSLYFLISFSTTGLFDLSIFHAYAMMKLLTVRNINALCYITIVITYKDHYVYYILPFHNKNTLTGPANCKKTTRHHAHLSCAKSMKINDGKSRKWPNPQFGWFFDNFEVKYLQIANFSEK